MNEDQLRKELSKMRNEMRKKAHIKESHRVNDVKWEDLKINLKSEQPPLEDENDE